MRITFLCPSVPEPVGGVLSLYNLANALHRRGHEVQVGHLELWGKEGVRPGDLDWFAFEPGIRHHFEGGPDSSPWPVGDIVFGTEAPTPLGLPVLLVQGVDMLHPWLERRAFRTPCLKICVASWLVDVGVRYGAPPQQFAVALCGLDPARFVVRTPPEQRPSQVAVLHHTHVAKGWEVALAALEKAHARVPHLTAAVFGTNAPKERLPPWATFHLAPDHDTLSSEIYGNSQVFLQASHYEGLGLTAIEAMSSGCALVTTDCGGSRDYAEHGRTALVAPAGDALSLADHIVTLLGDAPTRLRLAEDGRRHVQRFDWDEGAATVETHLERYVSDPAGYQQPAGDEQPFESTSHLIGVQGVPTAPRPG